MAQTNEVYGHLLSPKSVDLDRDTLFFFTTLQSGARLFVGINQKLTPVTSATLHRWIKLISGEYHEDFFLCPVTVHSAGIMSYSVRPSGPVIEPDSTEPLAPGNYGWYFDRECRSRGPPGLSFVRQRHVNFEYYFTNALPESQRAIREPISPTVEESVSVRDGDRCRFTGSRDDAVAAWIIPPDISWETDDSCDNRGWDKTPFYAGANATTMRKELVFHFHRNYFTVDVDDNYRILIFRAMGDVQDLLPSHLPPQPQQDAAADHFLRLHCRHCLLIMLRGGDIGEIYSDWAIIPAMEELGVDYNGNPDPDRPMLPLSDPRWQTVLGKAILTHVLESRADGLSSSSGSASNSRSPSTAGDQALYLPETADWGGLPSDEQFRIWDEARVLDNERWAAEMAQEVERPVPRWARSSVGESTATETIESSTASNLRSPSPKGGQSLHSPETDNRDGPPEPLPSWEEAWGWPSSTEHWQEAEPAHPSWFPSSAGESTETVEPSLLPPPP